MRGFHCRWLIDTCWLVNRQQKNEGLVIKIIRWWSVATFTENGKTWKLILRKRDVLCSENITIS